MGVGETLRHRQKDKTMGNPKKVSIDQLKGTLGRRGRHRYQNPEMLEMLKEMVQTGEPLALAELFTVTAKTTETEITNAKATWRNRASSLFDSLNTGKKISISWTDKHEMVIFLKENA